MKNAVRFKIGISVIAIGMLSLNACKKDNNNAHPGTGTDTLTNTALTDVDDNGGYASDYARLEQLDNDIINIADAAYQSSGSNLKVTGGGVSPLGSCATITNDISVMPHVLTINFGSTNCAGVDGRNRRGKILISYQDRYKDSGSVRTITFDNYFVNDNQVMGTKTVTNNGTNTAGNVYYSIVANDSISLDSGGTIKWASSRTREWQAGYGTATRQDDVYQITGGATITRANGHVFGVEITSPLLVALNCQWVEEGTLQITPAKTSNNISAMRILDYGSTATCDAQATLTIGTKTYNITLK